MTQTEFKQVTADPSALGLLGLAMVTLVASSQKLGWTEGVGLIIPWAIFLGATAQFAASMIDFKKNNIFGATAFGGFGLFWFSVGMSWMINSGILKVADGQVLDTKQLGFAFIGYLIFTAYMTIGAAETNKVLFIIFILIDCLFIGLSLSSFGIAEEATHRFAAWSEFSIAMFSFYGSAAAVLNGHFGKVFLPIGKPLGIFKK